MLSMSESSVRRYMLGPDEPRPFARELTSAARFPLRTGRYRLVYGIPRKLWPITIEGERHNIEAYRYEAKDRVLEEYSVNLKDETALDRVKPILAFELEGRFSYDGCYWPSGARAMVIRHPDDPYRHAERRGDIEIIEFPDLRFRLYEGDEIYNQDRLIFRWAAGQSLSQMFLDPHYVHDGYRNHPSGRQGGLTIDKGRLYLDVDDSPSFFDPAPAADIANLAARSLALGDQFLSWGGHDEAIRHYRLALELHPAPAIRAKALDNMAVAYHALHKYREAAANAREALEIDCNIMSAWKTLASSLEQLGLHNDAEKCFREAVEVEPNSGSLLLDLGRFYQRHGKYEQAISAYRNVLELLNGNSSPGTHEEVRRAASEALREAQQLAQTKPTLRQKVSRIFRKRG